MMRSGTWKKLYELSQYRHLPNLYPPENRSLTFLELAEMYDQLKIQDSIIESIGQQIGKYNLGDRKWL